MKRICSIFLKKIFYSYFIQKKNCKSVQQIQQLDILKFLLHTAQNTAFGKYYDFLDLLNSDSSKLYQLFKRHLPLFDYESINAQWWYRSRNGEKNVCWPGKVKYYALSSGTSDASSKYIPVTKEMLHLVKKMGIKQFNTITNYPLPPSVLNADILMLGGSTRLEKGNGFWKGDMSGISAKNLPSLFSRIIYKPGIRIANFSKWEDRIEEIVNSAPNWDIGTICGLPSWVVLVLSKIVERYDLQDIRQIWPSLGIYIHGGVSLQPYEHSLKKLMGDDIRYMETYMASEGFFGFSKEFNSKTMSLCTDQHIFYEFIPFNTQNFDPNGNVYPQAQTLMAEHIEENVEYAVVISSCAGAWRYMIGDVIKFTDKNALQFVLIGRTKYSLNLCGEHVSLDNISDTVQYVNQIFELESSEFCVCGYYNDLGAITHHWFIGTDSFVTDLKPIINAIDSHLKLLNDDYAVERSSSLANVKLSILSTQTFIAYLKNCNQFGAMSKFPRVMKGGKAVHWMSFINNNLEAIDVNNETLNGKPFLAKSN